MSQKALCSEIRSPVSNPPVRNAVIHFIENDNGSFNTATGYRALYSNDFGGSNRANGAYALL
jgi:hypothetical protein